MERRRRAKSHTNTFSRIVQCNRVRCNRGSLLVTFVTPPFHHSVTLSQCDCCILLLTPAFACDTPITVHSVTIVFCLWHSWHPHLNTVSPYSAVISGVWQFGSGHKYAKEGNGYLSPNRTYSSLSGRFGFSYNCVCVWDLNVYHWNIWYCDLEQTSRKHAYMVIVCYTQSYISIGYTRPH